MDCTGTRYIVKESKHPSLFLILCDDQHADWDRLENVKRLIRERRDFNKIRQSYTTEEVVKFLETVATMY